MDNLWLKVENIVTKGEIASAAEASESIYMRERVKRDKDGKETVIGLNSKNDVLLHT